MTVTSEVRLTNPSGAPVIVLDTSVRKKIQLTFTKTLTPDKRKGGGGNKKRTSFVRGIRTVYHSKELTNEKSCHLTTSAIRTPHTSRHYVFDC